MRYAFFYPNSKQQNLKSQVKNVGRLRWVEGFMCGTKGLSISNVDDYGMRTIHESNALLPVTRHQYRKMCNKDILQGKFKSPTTNQNSTFNISKGASKTQYSSFNMQFILKKS